MTLNRLFLPLSLQFIIHLLFTEVITVENMGMSDEN
jgi:hypothetical protein